MKREYNTIIIGAGPAGLSCAIELQKSSKSVLLLDKNKEIGPKVCAGGLTTKVEQLDFPLGKADLVFSSIRVSLSKEQKVLSNERPFVATIDRVKLGKILLEKLSNNVDVKLNSEVTKINDGSIEVDGQEIKYGYLVGADGGNSLVRKFLGLKTQKILATIQYVVPWEVKELELFTDASLFGWGYAWIFPHKGYTSVGCCRDVRFLGKNSLKNGFDMWLKDKQVDVSKGFLQGGNINYDYQGFDFGNKFLIGDAAGFASGISGEGIYFAMVSGMEVAKKIMNSGYKTPGINQILRTKYIHELLLILLPNLNEKSLKIFFRFCSFLLNYKYIKNKILKLYC